MLIQKVIRFILRKKANIMAEEITQDWVPCEINWGIWVVEQLMAVFKGEEITQDLVPCKIHWGSKVVEQLMGLL